MVKNNFYRNNRGFTIVELLIVIVVIAILAAITIVAFNGVQLRANEAALKSDLKNGATQLGLDQVEGGAYPANLADANNKNGLKKSKDTTFQYTSADKNSFCLTATSNRAKTLAFYVTNDGSIQEGVCLNHVAPSDNPGTAQWEPPVAISGASCTPIAFAASPDTSKVSFYCNSFASSYASSIDGGISWVRSASSFTSYTNLQLAQITDTGSRYVGFGSTKSSTEDMCIHKGTVAGTSVSATRLCNSKRFVAMAASGDGNRLIFGDAGPGLYVSNDAGNSSTRVLNAVGWTGGQFSVMALSRDGGTCVAALSDQVAVSSNGCVQWSYKSLPLNADSIGVSDDGKLIAVADSRGSRIMISTDSGGSWVAAADAGSRKWSRLKVSGDGSKLLGMAENILYFSSDRGETWKEYGGFGSSKIENYAISSDGSKVVLVATPSAGKVDVYRGAWQ